MAFFIGNFEALQTFDRYDDSSYALIGPQDVEVVEFGGRRFAYVSASTSDGLSVFEINADGTLSFLRAVGDTGGVALDGASSLASITIGQNTFLYAAGENDNGITLYQVGAGGSLTFIQSIFDNATLQLDNPTSAALSVVQSGGNDFLLASGYQDDGVSVFQISTDGTLVNRDNVTDSSNPNFGLRGTEGIASAEVGGVTYVYVAGYADSSITKFALSSTGQLTYDSTTIDNGTLNLSGVSYLEKVSVGGNDFLVAGGSGDDGLSVFSIGNNGVLSNVSNISSTSQLDFVEEISSVVIGGETFLVASARNSSAITLLSMAGDGSLTLLNTIYDASSAIAELRLPTGNAVIDVNGEPIVLVAATGDSNFTSLALGGADDVFNGTAGLDTMFGLSGDDTLTGFAAADVLNGGSGTDTASYIGSDAGVTVSLESGSGFGGHAQGDTLTGIENLTGSSFSDVFYGDAGNNIINGNGGTDFLIGGAGDDTLNGGIGGDILFHGAGADSFDGGTGIDYVTYAVAGAVTIDLLNNANNAGDAAGDTFVNVEAFFLSANNDRAVGDASNNFFFAQGGNDVLLGNGGGDIFYGEGGNDFIITGGLSDIVVLGAGNDTVYYTINQIEQDQILDFTSGEDRLEFEGEFFNMSLGGVTQGVNFILTTTAQGAAYAAGSGVLIYYTDTGQLYADNDGAGGAAANLIAALGANTTLAASDITIVDRNGIAPTPLSNMSEFDVSLGSSDEWSSDFGMTHPGFQGLAPLGAVASRPAWLEIDDTFAYVPPPVGDALGHSRLARSVIDIEPSARPGMAELLERAGEGSARVYSVNQPDLDNELVDVPEDTLSWAWA